jgi:hydroxymethylbilane synthase
MTLRIGTRGSALALWQARWIESSLRALHPGLDVELVIIKTRGDAILDRPLSEVGGKGLFVKEIENALLDGSVDIAVHSLKDMPVDQPEGLELVAYPERASAFDALCPARPGETLATLPHGARVGTTSLRRGAQLLHMRPDLQVVSIRGNVETRLGRRFGADPLDAVVLAEAGLRRLDRWEPSFEVLAPPVFVPAPAQGCVTVEARHNDEATRALLAPLDHADTRLAITAERACLRGIEGDCHTPFAAWARRDDHGGLVLSARLMNPDGHTTEAKRMVVLREDPLAQAVDLGQVMARNLLERHNATLPRS